MEQNQFVNDVDKVINILAEVRQHLVKASILFDCIDPQIVVDMKIALITDLSVKDKSIRVDLIGDTSYMEKRCLKLLDKVNELGENKR